MDEMVLLHILSITSSNHRYIKIINLRQYTSIIQLTIKRVYQQDNSFYLAIERIEMYNKYEKYNWLYFGGEEI